MSFSTLFPSQDFIAALKNKSDELRTTHKFENIMMSDKLMDCATSMVEVYGQDIMNFTKVLKSLLNKVLHSRDAFQAVSNLSQIAKSVSSLSEPSPLFTGDGIAGPYRGQVRGEQYDERAQL